MVTIACSHQLIFFFYFLNALFLFSFFIFIKNLQVTKRISKIKTKVYGTIVWFKSDTELKITIENGINQRNSSVCHDFWWEWCVDSIEKICSCDMIKNDPMANFKTYHSNIHPSDTKTHTHTTKQNTQRKRELDRDR